MTRFRVLLIICVPILLSGILSTMLMAQLMSQQLYQQSQQFGRATTDQLAITVVDHLINEDLLSLNLLVRNAIVADHFDFVSVYNLDNKLLAQAGRSHPQNRTFHQQVTVQNVVSGYVEVGYNDSLIDTQINQLILISISLHCLVLLLVGAILWWFGDLLYLWALQIPSSREAPQVETVAIEDKKTDLPQTTILVAKLRPARLLPRYKSVISQALALHKGEVTQSGDDLIVLFDQPDQVLQAIRAAQLLIYVTELLPANLEIKLGLHQSLNKDEISPSTKQASYLASNSQQQILTSRTVKERFEQTDKFSLIPYQSAMTPDGQVFQVEQLSDQALLAQQATKLTRSI